VDVWQHLPVHNQCLVVFRLMSVVLGPVSLVLAALFLWGPRLNVWGLRLLTPLIAITGYVASLGLLIACLNFYQYSPYIRVQLFPSQNQMSIDFQIPPNNSIEELWKWKDRFLKLSYRAYVEDLSRPIIIASVGEEHPWHQTIITTARRSRAELKFKPNDWKSFKDAFWIPVLIWPFILMVLCIMIMFPFYIRARRMGDRWFRFDAIQPSKDEHG